LDVGKADALPWWSDTMAILFQVLLWVWAVCGAVVLLAVLGSLLDVQIAKVPFRVPRR